MKMYHRADFYFFKKADKMSDKAVGGGHRRAAVQADSFSDAYMFKVFPKTFLPMHASEEKNSIRINKLLASLGICSRREADRLIAEGRVRINAAAALAGDRVFPGDRVFLDGKEVDTGEREQPVLLACNKPRGVVCTSSDKDRAPNIIDLVSYKSRVYPIGRLDKDSEGLILLTNMGELVNRINKGAGGHEKEYEVELYAPLPAGFIEGLKMGVTIEVPDRGRVRAHCKDAWQTGDRSFHIILTEGMNRQIRRMSSALGGRVKRLRRIRIMNIRLGGLKPGAVREISGDELSVLLSSLGDGMKSAWKDRT